MAKSKKIIITGIEGKIEPIVIRGKKIYDLDYNSRLTVDFSGMLSIRRLNKIKKAIEEICNIDKKDIIHQNFGKKGK